ncbi:TetR/AcrR family transcriptional regulator [Oceanicola sp. 22II-s10i]|uniref:TetR/AcrR family transcriptional regulator n=1 Tax=Oceanicola sp. 22II-s10i TaxID=1317116 RepID=UPI000B5268A5|nr:TetR/AcrR family transcriptional regulator [Oceanicola sp. 22II-s10i]
MPEDVQSPSESDTKSGAEAEVSTRERLLTTAERLYAQDGIAAVSLRRINREAGQANASALHYHFGSRDELISAILERRMADVNRRRIEVLDTIRMEGRIRDPRALCEALVGPLSEQVFRSDGQGTHYLGFVASIYNSSEINVYDLSRKREDRSLRDLGGLFVEALPELPDWTVRLRYSMTVRSVIYALADWERERHISGIRPGMPFEEFVSLLVDMTFGTMTAPHTQPG